MIAMSQTKLQSI